MGDLELCKHPPPSLFSLFMCVCARYLLPKDTMTCESMNRLIGSVVLWRRHTRTHIHHGSRRSFRRLFGPIRADLCPGKSVDLASTLLASRCFRIDQSVGHLQVREEIREKVGEAQQIDLIGSAREFIDAVDWTEPFVLCLFGFHLVVALGIALGRNNQVWIKVDAEGGKKYRERQRKERWRWRWSGRRTDRQAWPID